MINLSEGENWLQMNKICNFRPLEQGARTHNKACLITVPR